MICLKCSNIQLPGVLQYLYILLDLRPLKLAHIACISLSVLRRESCQRQVEILNSALNTVHQQVCQSKTSQKFRGNALDMPIVQAQSRPHYQQAIVLRAVCTAFLQPCAHVHYMDSDNMS